MIVQFSEVRRPRLFFVVETGMLIQSRMESYLLPRFLQRTGRCGDRVGSEVEEWSDLVAQLLSHKGYAAHFVQCSARKIRIFHYCVLHLPHSAAFYPGIKSV